MDPKSEQAAAAMLMDGNSVTHHPDLHLRSVPCTGGLDAPETGAPDRRSPTLLTGVRQGAAAPSKHSRGIGTPAS